MSIFRCDVCGCRENTALSYYWFRNEDKDNPEKKALCTECHPRTKKWHGCFPKESAKGWVRMNDDFIYPKAFLETDSFKWRAEHQGLKVVEECT
jgi:hypothetical protein